MVNEFCAMAEPTAKEMLRVQIHRGLVWVCTALLSVVTFFVIKTFYQLDRMQDAINSHEVAIQLTRQQVDDLETQVRLLNQTMNSEVAKTTILNGKVDAIQDFFIDEHK